MYLSFGQFPRDTAVLLMKLIKYLRLTDLSLEPSSVSLRIMCILLLTFRQTQIEPSIPLRDYITRFFDVLEVIL
jgi:hypothetical protein